MHLNAKTEYKSNCVVIVFNFETKQVHKSKLCTPVHFCNSMIFAVPYVLFYFFFLLTPGNALALLFMEIRDNIAQRLVFDEHCMCSINPCLTGWNFVK